MLKGAAGSVKAIKLKKLVSNVIFESPERREGLVSTAIAQVRNGSTGSITII